MRLCDGPAVGPAAAVALLVGLLAGCSAVQGAAGERTAGGGAGVPVFIGPYAELYAQSWAETDSEFVHAVLADGRITEQEWSEVRQRLTDCLTAAGFTRVTFEKYGGYTSDIGSVAGDQAQTVADACEKESGEHPIASLRQSSLVNPENRDMNELVAECLVNRGLAAAGYSGADLARENASGEVLRWQASPDFHACNQDPLSLLR